MQREIRPPPSQAAIRPAGPCTSSFPSATLPTRRDPPDRWARGAPAIPGIPLSAAATVACVLDAAGRVVKVNDASCRMYGYTRDELLGQSVTLIASPEEATATAVGNETGAVSAIATTERAMRSGKTE